MTAVGIALIGAGRWGTVLGKALARVSDAELRWICEIDAGRRAQAASIHPTARVTADLEQVLADPEVAAAAVAVDSPLHHPIGLQVLRADRHLLVEKPMALSTADATELVAAASSRGRVLWVGHLLLHHPAVVRAHELVTSGALGEISHLEAARLTSGNGPVTRSAWWSLAPHDVSLALRLLEATPVQVAAIGVRRRGEPDSVVWATLSFDDGRLAHLHVGRIGDAKTRRVSVVGSRRILTFDELAERPLHLVDLNGTEIDLEGSSFSDVDPLLSQCRHFVSGVAHADTSAGNGAHALAVVRVLEAGARSMDEGGTPVQVR